MMIKSNTNARITRREAVGSILALGGAALLAPTPAAATGVSYKLATFSVDVTPPLGHPLMGGGVQPAATIEDPLYAHGIVLQGAGPSIVLLAVDWCEIRNDAYQRWREVLAAAAETTPERVVLASVHQHDAPIADLEAQRILEAQQCAGAICNLEFHETVVQRVAASLRRNLLRARRITHLGLGSAEVERLASNRRYRSADGTLRFDRTSSTRNEEARAAPEGTIDPTLRTVSFWDGKEPVAALNFYAVHPMSYYGRGDVTADFIGLARKRRRAELPGVQQIYFSGCSGNVTAGKYNEGTPLDRANLADRLHAGMAASWEATECHPLESLAFRSVPLRLEPRDTAGFTVADLEARLTSDERPFGQCLAALGLSWRARADRGGTIDVPVLDLGPAQVLLLPAEAYVEYQLLAQQLRPDRFIAVAGYGECAPGYIPIDERWSEGDTNLNDWCWVAEGSEAAMRSAIAAALQVPEKT